MEDQRICIKFCVKNGFKGAEIFWMLQTAYGNAVMSQRRVFEWYKRFKEGREETADNERSGSPSTSTMPEKVDKVLKLRVITGDETWIYGFDSETTQQASEWRFKNEPRPKKARKAPSKVKVMLTVFFDYQGIVHHEFQQQGSTITADSYLGVLSPDLAPCDFFLFGKLKKKLKGWKFQSVEEIKVESKRVISKTDYQRRIEISIAF
ncbi:hypothetical protein LAZ67_8000538 [Cordylochernes scorpioides]|uniref:Mos1 transposase HTH domain-containing protein n=1 Tax=Cordylochernes scorpioides TaxID=51811 RepID=A0ABY6KSR1_9ARAC|nr:hypothetical protein LAZ67_8000538 [Cordylochernes scorpioides]